MQTERVRDFFNDKLPRLMVARSDAAERTRAVITVFVQGAGQWTISLGANPSVSKAPSLDADLIVTWDTAQFCSVLDGEVVAPPVSMGDLKRLDALGRLMIPAARGGLGARLMCA